MGLFSLVKLNFQITDLLFRLTARLIKFFVKLFKQLETFKDSVFNLEIALLHVYDTGTEFLDLTTEEFFDPVEIPLTVMAFSGKFFLEV